MFDNLTFYPQPILCPLHHIIEPCMDCLVPEVAEKIVKASKENLLTATGDGVLFVGVNLDNN